MARKTNFFRRRIGPVLCTRCSADTHITATGVTFVALLLSFSTHVTFTLLASLTAFLAATITLVAFAIDIALYVFVKHEVGKLAGVSANTDTAPGASRRVCTPTRIEC